MVESGQACPSSSKLSRSWISIRLNLSPETAKYLIILMVESGHGVRARQIIFHVLAISYTHLKNKAPIWAGYANALLYV